MTDDRPDPSACVLNPFQRELLQAVAVEHATPLAIWGGIGCGKTIGLAQLVYLVAETRPGCTILFGMDSAPAMNNITRPACDAVFGHLPHWKWRTLERVYLCDNGSRVILRYYEDAPSTRHEGQNPWEGIDAHLVVVDEAQKFRDDTVLKHASDRARATARDLNGVVHPACVVINGRPSVVDWWPKACEAAGGVVLRPKSYVNRANLDAGWFDRQRRVRTAAEYAAVIEGAPMPVDGGVFADWSAEAWPDGNVLDGWAYDPTRPVYVAVDFGVRYPAALLIQSAEVDGEVLDVVFGEVAPDDALTPDLCRMVLEEARAAGWALGEAVVDMAGTQRSMDTGRSDVEIVRAELGIPVVYITDPGRRDLRNGITRVQRLIRTADGRRRLVCTQALWDAGRSVGPTARSFAKAVSSYTWHAAMQPARGWASAGAPNHHMDALRYYVARYRWDIGEAPAPHNPTPGARPGVERIIKSRGWARGGGR